MGNICDFIISVFCPQKLSDERRFNLSNTFRVYVLWFFLVGIFLTAGLVHGLGKFYARKTVPFPDELYYVDWIQNDFCSHVNLTTKWPLRINAYLLDKKTTDRSLCNQSTEIIGGPVSVTVPANDIYTMKLSLGVGSRISGQICMSHAEKIYIFTRKMDFLRCIRGDSWTVCGLRGPTRYKVESDCKDFDNFDNPYILPPQSISTSGEYYFIFYNSLSNDIPVSARFTRTIFNEQLIKKSQKSCHDETLCEFDLGSVSESKTACFEAVRYTPFPGDEVGKDVQVSCKPRLWLYFMLFFILPIIIGIIGTVLICKCCNKNGSSYEETGSGVSSPRRYTPSSQTQRNVPSAPLRDRRNDSPRSRPTYHDISLENRNVNQTTDSYAERNRSVFQDDTLPPSYEEVMKGVIV